MQLLYRSAVAHLGSHGVVNPKTEKFLYFRVHDAKFKLDTKLPLQINHDYVVSVRASGYVGFATFRAEKTCVLTLDTPESKFSD